MKKQSDYKRVFRKYQDFFYPVAILLVILVSLRIYFFPSLTEVFALRDKIATKQRELNDTAAYFSYLESVTSAAVVAEEEVVNYALPDEKNTITLLVTLEGIAKAAGAQVSKAISLRPGALSSAEETTATNAKKETKDVLPLEMEVLVENVDQSQLFLSEIYKARRVLEITDLRWDLLKDNRIRLKVGMNAFYLPSQQVKATRSLAESVQQQSALVTQLGQTKIYEDVVINGSSLGKNDPFSPSQPQE